MTWDNGITYEGGWLHGMYHGVGTKGYSRGGGYVGPWLLGRRDGVGVSLFGGKWGFEQWEGLFVDDLPHGAGVMTLCGGGTRSFEFVRGEPATVT